MSKLGKVITAFIVVTIIAVGALFLMGGKTNKTTQKDQNNANGPIAATITYTDSGFSLSTRTISSGQTFKIVNQSQQEIDLSSDPHPTHTGDPELNVGSVQPGGSKTFILTTKGTWGFHNHYDHTKTGTITVK